MSYYAEHDALQTLVEKERKEGLTKAEEALQSVLLNELGIDEDSVDVASVL